MIEFFKHTSIALLAAAVSLHFGYYKPPSNAPDFLTITYQVVIASGALFTYCMSNIILSTIHFMRERTNKAEIWKEIDSIIISSGLVAAPIFSTVILLLYFHTNSLEFETFLFISGGIFISTILYTYLINRITGTRT
tara:strand:+ start:2951 stop:3361 length:411 start_codon:yes stop_codon:yes gene_type:complete